MRAQTVKAESRQELATVNQRCRITRYAHRKVGGDFHAPFTLRRAPRRPSQKVVHQVLLPLTRPLIAIVRADSRSSGAGSDRPLRSRSLNVAADQHGGHLHVSARQGDDHGEPKEDFQSESVKDVIYRRSDSDEHREGLVALAVPLLGHRLGVGAAGSVRGGGEGGIRARRWG